MNRRLYVVLVVAACREKHVPYTPPVPDDAPALAIDAPAPIDAAVAIEKARPVKVATGDRFSCAVMSDARARCWGANNDGQLGDGTTTDRPSPVTVPISGVVDIAVGTAHACALLDDSSVTCWGRINKPTGVQGAKRIFAVEGAACASLTDASLVCWGNVDAKGHVRRSADAPANRAPTPVPDVTRVIAVTATGVLRDDGTAPWFGDKVTLVDVTEIAADGEGLCGLRRDGVVICAGPRHCKWTKKNTPAPAIEELVLAKAKHLAFDAGTCVLTIAGKQQCLSKSDGCRADAPVARRNVPKDPVPL
jgi:alpha-tubulin suppressor-like RCC1 family protein